MNALMATKIKQQDKDEISLVRCAVTDVDAFAELYRRHLTRVYRYHMAHVGNVKDAEDLTSQTFVAVLEGIRTFRGSGSFAAWVMGIASKKRLMFFRNNGTRSGVPLEAALQYPSRDPLTDKAVEQRLEFESIFQALQKIPPDRA